MDEPIPADKDYLVEFLDPRVYDSSGARTPVSTPNGTGFATTCRGCSTGNYSQCNNCAGSTLGGSFHNEMFLRVKEEINQADLISDDILHFGPVLDLPLDAPVDGVDPFLRFDDNSDYLYTHQPDMDVSESGSPSETMITRATSTNSLSFALGGLSSEGHRPMVKTESGDLDVFTGGLSCNTLPLSILDDHEETRKELAKVKFGNPNMNPCPPTIDVMDASSVLDFLPETMAKMQYQLEVLDLPLHSRVETQIKLKFKFSPAPRELLLHVPQDLISKNKFCLADPVETLSDTLRSNMLFMDTYVMTSDLLQSCRVCSRCIKREQKRALRLKGSENNNDEEQVVKQSASSTRISALANNACVANPWDNEQMVKKAIIYNCKEIVSFLPPSGLPDDQSKLLNFSARLICYCRHHKEAKGFKLLVVVRDYLGNIKGKCVSGPIMIMDRKKTLSASSRSGVPTQNGTIGSMTPGARPASSNGATPASQRPLGMCNDAPLNPSDLTSLHPLSPNSIDDLTSDLAARGLKRKKMSYDDLYNSFSPVSNSDTNASVHAASIGGNLSGYNMNGKGGVLHIAPSTLPRVHLQQQLLSQLQLLPNDTSPCIQKIIPAQGPCRGGIEVTLLGYNFRPGLIVKFGAKNALATHCWSESTIVTYLPPSAHAGQVLVSFENEVIDQAAIAQNQHTVFTYTDDTDRQLIELALQIVGLKMNGKLEDAKNIAKRIVGLDKNTDGSNQGLPQQANGGSHNASPMDQQEHQMWYDNAHRAVQTLTRSDLSTEEILINFMSLVDLPNCPIIIPNWNLANLQGQTLAHLACLKNYSKLVRFLISHGTKLNVKDNLGLTPFFMALTGGYRSLMELLLAYRPTWNLKLSNDKYLKDYCDMNVLDIFERLEAGDNGGAGARSASSAAAADRRNSGSQHQYSSSNGSQRRRKSSSVDEPLNRSLSLDSLNSINMNSYGRHVSRMITESVSEEKGGDSFMAHNESAVDDYDSGIHSGPAQLNSASSFGNESDFADSELDSDDDLYIHHSESDYEDYDYEDDIDTSDDGEESAERAQNPEFKNLTDAQGLATLSAEDSDITDGSPRSKLKKRGFWNKMKRTIFSLAPDETTNLPSYDDLFPGGSGEMRPKLEMERALNQASSAQELSASSSSQMAMKVDDDAGIALDLSEDIALSYINRPRTTVRNDKMLLFFWIPVLILISSLFIYVSITGYKVQVIEHFKEKARNTLGNVMVGNERLARVFRKNQIGQLI